MLPPSRYNDQSLLQNAFQKKFDLVFPNSLRSAEYFSHLLHDHTYQVVNRFQKIYLQVLNHDRATNNLTMEYLVSQPFHIFFVTRQDFLIHH